MKDLRDPCALGLKLLDYAQRDPLERLSVVADRAPLNVPDTPSEGPLERYGDPVAQHEAKIAAGLAARLP